MIGWMRPVPRLLALVLLHGCFQDTPTGSQAPGSSSESDPATQTTATTASETTFGTTTFGTTTFWATTFGTTTFGTTSEGLPQGPCEGGDPERSGTLLDSDTAHCYQFRIGDFAWDRASLECESDDGHLATITTVEELGFVELLLAQEASKSDEVWIGLRRDGLREPFAWVTEEAVDLDLLNWNMQQGNEQPNEDDAESACAYAWGVADWRWHDAPCGESGIAFVCEWEPLPAP